MPCSNWYSVRCSPATTGSTDSPWFLSEIKVDTSARETVITGPGSFSVRGWSSRTIRAVIILAVLAIGSGAAPPELPTWPRPSTTSVASPCAGQGNAGAVPMRWATGTTGVAALTGNGRRY